MLQRLSSFAAIALVAFACAAAVSCGGKVVFEPTGAGGAGGTGGATSSSVSSIASVGTGASCPEFPAINGFCSIPGQVCPVPFGCCGGSAVCNAGRWGYQGPACSQPCLPCFQNFGCTPGAVCLALEGDAFATFECRMDPCPGSTDCGCAQQLCTDGALHCASHTATQITCDCPTC
jgi:hypothetical protein